MTPVEAPAVPEKVRGEGDTCKLCTSPPSARMFAKFFEKLESYCIKLASLIARYSVLIYCAKEKN